MSKSGNWLPIIEEVITVIKQDLIGLACSYLAPRVTKSMQTTKSGTMDSWYGYSLERLICIYKNIPSTGISTRIASVLYGSVRCRLNKQITPASKQQNQEIYAEAKCIFSVLFLEGSAACIKSKITKTILRQKGINR